MDKQLINNIDDDTLKTNYYIFFEFFGYFVIFIILFAFMFELNAYIFIFILIIIMHIIFNLKLFKEVKNIFENPSNGALGIFISFILFSTMLLRTMGLFLFSYTNGKITYISKKNDEEIRIPKKFQKNDKHFKFLFIASTIASFIIFFLIKFYNGEVLSMDMDMNNSTLKIFISLIIGAISYGFSNIIPHNYAFETVVYTIMFFIILLTLIKVIMSFVSYDINIGPFYYQLIAIVTTCCLAITSAFEFKNAYEYKDLHNKYELEKEPVKLETEDDRKWHYYKEMVINILLLIFAIIMFFIVGMYASGTGGSKPIYLLIIAILIGFYMLKDVFGDINNYVYNSMIFIINILSVITNAIINGCVFTIKMLFNYVIKPILILFKNILLLFKQLINDFISMSKQN